MADIKDQLIKDSYNYVLQSDLSTGVVYRIGGSVPVNPIFSSGLTINDSFVYSGAGEQNGYVLLTDGTGYAYWAPSSGLTVSGLTYYVLPTVPPGTGYTNGDRWFDTSTGDETVWINDGVGYGQWVQPNNGGGGGSSPYSGSGVSNFLTIWNSTYGLSASTIQYNGNQYLIPSLSSTTITGSSIYSTNYQGNVVTYLSNGSGIILDNNTGSIQITNSDPGSGQNIFKDIYIDDIYQFSASDNSDDLRFSGIGVTITSGTNNTLIFSAGTSSQSVSGDYLPLSGGTVTGETIFQSGLTANTISATTYYNLPVSGLTEGNGISITGTNSNFTISYTGSTGVSGDYLPLSGGTVTGDTIFQSGLTATTISATTYQNLPVSGLTSGTNIGLTNNNGNYTISFTGTTGSNFTGGTLSGATIFTGGLSANTISATTYYNLPVSGLTSGTGIGITNNNNNFTIAYTGQTSFPYLPLSGGTVTGVTTFATGLTYSDSIGVDRYSGEIVKFGAGSTSASILYYYSSGTWSATDANSPSFSTKMLGIGISPDNATPSSPSTDGILVRGYARLYYPGGTWSDGDILYVADNAGGEITNIAPTTSGYVVRIVGYVVDGASDLIYFCPDNTWIELV